MKILGNYRFFGGFKGGEVHKPKAYFYGGWENQEKQIVSELLDKAKK